MKKIFIISTVLLLVVLVFLAIYNFVYRQKDSSIAVIDSDRASQTSPVSSEPGRVVDTRDNQPGASEPSDTEPATDSEPSVEEKVIAVTDFPVISPTVDAAGENILVYDKTDGRLRQIPVAGGATKTFDETPLPDLVYAAWSPDKEKVLTKFVSPEDGVRIYFYNHKLQSGVKLKDGIKRVDWLPDGAEIIYLYKDPGTKRVSLNISRPDGSGWRSIGSNLLENMRFAGIPQTPRVLLWDAPSPETKTRLRLISLINKGARPKTVFERGYNADFLPSPDGEKILVSTAAKRGSNERFLGLLNSSGRDYKHLGIPTNVSKCTWSANGKFIYCALPTGDRDTFWKINVSTGEQQRLVDLGSITASQTRYNAFDLFLTPDNGALFFVNKLDGKLYRLLLD